MTIDLSITQDPQWRAKREISWAEQEDEIAEGISKKRFLALKKYFFDGVVEPGFDVTSCVLDFFPLASIEAVSFALKFYVNIDLVNREPHQFKGMVNAIMSIGGHSNATDQERADLWSYTFGESYQPDRKFPFYLADETELRPIPCLMGEQYIRMTGLYNRLPYESFSNNFFRLDSRIVNYYFSLFPRLTEEMFVEEADFKAARRRIDGEKQLSYWRTTDKTFQNILAPADDIKNGANYAKAKPFYDQLYTFFDQLTYPQNLAARWEKAKKEYGHE